VRRPPANKVMEGGLQRTRTAISEGKPNRRILKQVGRLPGMVVQMIQRRRSETGAMDAMLVQARPIVLRRRGGCRRSRPLTGTARAADDGLPEAARSARS